MRSKGLAGLFSAVLLAAIAALSQQSTESPAIQAVRLNNLGVAYMNQQRMADALQLFERALGLDPNLLTTRLNQAIALFNTQQLERSKEILLELTQKDPGNFRAWYNLGLAYRSLGQTESAIPAFRRVAQLSPDDPDTNYLLGLMLAQAQQHGEAIASFEKALALSPYHASAEFGLARSYQRLGDAQKAQQHLAQFQKITQEKLGAPMGMGYGDQGPYSVAAFASAPSDTPSAIQVRFVSVAGEAGLSFTHSTDSFPSSGASTVAPFLGSGACFLDYDDDDRVDVFLLDGAPDRAARLFRNVGNGRFTDATEAAGISIKGYGLACSAADYDNDQRVDIAVSLFSGVVLLHNTERHVFEDVTAAAGINDVSFPLGVNFIDYDHDGDVDLYVSHFVNFPMSGSGAFELPRGTVTPGNKLWRNNGNGRFTDSTAVAGLAATGPSIGSVGTDFNNDRAVDLVVTGLRIAPSIFVNPREGAFTPIDSWSEPVPPATAGVVATDFNKDGWLDLAFTHWGEPGLTLWRNTEGKRLERASLSETNWTRGWGLAALDYDNDGWIDLAAVGEGPQGAELRLWRNRGKGAFENVTASTGLNEIKLDRPRALITADVDNDGDTDLLVTQNRGPAILLRNDGGNQNSWIRLSFRGLNDNKSAIGTKVEVFAGTQWQKWEVPGSSGYLGNSALPVAAGLGNTRDLETVRMLWPTGVWQDEVQLATRQNHTVTEIDRRGSSCPVLFVWNGQRYEFITDVIGAGVVGHWVGPGERNVSDPTEYIKVEGRRVKPRNGRISFRFIEPMEELVYLDQAKLLAIDHPSDLDVYPNEYFAASPPFAPFKIIASRDARPLKGAWDDKRRSVLRELSQRDRRYVTSFESDAFPGFAKLHSLELDLGAIDTEGPVRLLMTGFIDYFTANSMFAADQAGVTAVVPYVEALDPSGKWIRITDDIGFPAGLWRTMVADLSGRLPAGATRIRIWTNLKIYWDQILVDRTSAQMPVRMTELPLASANLSHRGYPRQVEGSPPADLTYKYEEVSASGPYARHAGSFTRFGDVKNLLTAAEDQFVVFGSGDEVALEFDPAKLPGLPAGWTRDYFFYADGFNKDMDFYGAFSHTVEPLPYHTSEQYPYASGRAYPLDRSNLAYYLNYNTRHSSGRTPPAFRFHYRDLSRFKR